jgi:pimeloyl-ACP methyl ester carboxylesterase
MPVVRGVELAVTDTGGNGGLPYFWGHGLSGSSAQDSRFSMFDWKRLAGSRRVVRWDARGHGESAGTDEPDAYRWDNLARDLLELADALGVDRFVAGGVSMGAATALHAATIAPERIAGLVLVLAPTAYETRAAQGDLYTAGAELVDREGVAAYVAAQNDQPVPEILSAFADLYHVEPAISDHLLPSVLRGAGASDLPSPDAVRSVTVPTLLLPWDTDPGHPLSTSEVLAELLPNAEMHVARKLEDLGSWTDRVETYLASLD